MTPFETLTAIAAPLPVANIDTDMILPARFLTTIGRAGLGKGAFATSRQNPDFVLNRDPWTQAGILVALDNLGCGSSREHAPWALLDFGIRCVIAPSIADIFHNNCCKNGILPIVLPAATVDRLLTLSADPDTAEMTVDLPRQELRAGNEVIAFDIDPARKADLLAGTDDIARSLGHEREIARHEQEREAWRPRITQCRLDRLAAL